MPRKLSTNTNINKRKSQVVVVGSTSKTKSKNKSDDESSESRSGSDSEELNNDDDQLSMRSPSSVSESSEEVSDIDIDVINISNRNAISKQEEEEQFAKRTAGMIMSDSDDNESNHSSIINGKHTITTIKQARIFDNEDDDDAPLVVSKPNGKMPSDSDSEMHSDSEIESSKPSPAPKIKSLDKSAVKSAVKSVVKSPIKSSIKSVVKSPVKSPIKAKILSSPAKSPASTPVKKVKLNNSSTTTIATNEVIVPMEDIIPRNRLVIAHRPVIKLTSSSSNNTPMIDVIQPQQQQQQQQQVLQPQSSYKAPPITNATTSFQPRVISTPIAISPAYRSSPLLATNIVQQQQQQQQITTPNTISVPGPGIGPRKVYTPYSYPNTYYERTPENLEISSYLFPFVQSRRMNAKPYERAFKYGKPVPISRNILDIITPDWLVCVKPDGIFAVAAFTKQATYILVLNDRKDDSKDYLKYPSVLLSGKGVEFIAFGEWITVDDLEGNTVRHLFYPCDMFYYAPVLPCNKNESTWWKKNDYLFSSDNLDKRVSKLNNLLDQVVQCNTPIQVQGHTSTKGYGNIKVELFEVKPKCIEVPRKNPNRWENNVEKDKKEILNDGCMLLNPKSFLHGSTSYQQAFKWKEYHSVDVSIGAPDKSYPGYSNGDLLWYPNKVDVYNNPIYPILIKQPNVDETKSAGCERSHVMYKYKYFYHAILPNTTEGEALRYSIQSYFQTHEKAHFLVVECEIPKSSSSGWIITRLREDKDDGNDIFTLSSCMQIQRENITWDEIKDKLRKQLI